MSHPLHEIPLKKRATFLESVKDQIDGNLLLPHTVESGDAYYIGEVYDQGPPGCAQEWEIDRRQYPYLQHIKAIANSWTSLGYLADWMEVTTAPVKWNLIKTQEVLVRAERAKRTHIAVLDFDMSGTAADPVTVHPVESTARLRTALKEGPPPSDRSRLFVVEDLSRDVIELLGNELDIDPHFFRGHISDYSWFNTRDKWVEIPELPSIAHSRNYFTLKWMQPRRFENKEALTGARTEAGRFNVLRRLDDDKNQKDELDGKGTCFACVRSKASFWFSPAEPGSTGPVGVLLIDPSIKQGAPLWAVNRRYDRAPSNRSRASHEPPPTDLFDKVVYWTQRMSKEQIASIRENPKVMVHRMLQIICGDWLTLCDAYIPTRLAQVDWEFQNPDFSAYKKGSEASLAIKASLAKVFPWRRWIPGYKTMVTEAMAAVFSDENPTPRHDCIQDLRRDFKAVEASIDTLQQRIDNIQSVAMASINIEDSRQAMMQNQYFGRLAYLAAIFAPLSFVSSLFSMSGDLSGIKGTVWLYFCVAVPLSLLGLLLVDWARAKKVMRRSPDVLQKVKAGFGR